MQDPALHAPSTLKAPHCRMAWDFNISFWWTPFNHPQLSVPWKGVGGTSSLQEVPKTLIYRVFAGNLEKQVMDFQKQNNSWNVCWLCGGLPHVP